MSEALVERLNRSTIGALELLHVYIGERLGLYEALSRGGPLTPAQLAAAAAIKERYAREWLEEQAVASWRRNPAMAIVHTACRASTSRCSSIATA